MKLQVTIKNISVDIHNQRGRLAVQLKQSAVAEHEI